MQSRLDDALPDRSDIRGRIRGVYVGRMARSPDAASRTCFWNRNRARTVRDDPAGDWARCRILQDAPPEQGEAEEPPHSRCLRLWTLALGRSSEPIALAACGIIDVMRSAIDSH